MSSTTSSVTPQLGGLAGVALFLVTVLAFVAESQLTQVWNFLPLLPFCILIIGHSMSRPTYTITNLSSYCMSHLYLLR